MLGADNTLNTDANSEINLLFKIDLRSLKTNKKPVVRESS
jgi:hypothetical protein